MKFFRRAQNQNTQRGSFGTVIPKQSTTPHACVWRVNLELQCSAIESTCLDYVHRQGSGAYRCARNKSAGGATRVAHTHDDRRRCVQWTHRDTDRPADTPPRPFSRAHPQSSFARGRRNKDRTHDQKNTILSKLSLRLLSLYIRWATKAWEGASDVCCALSV